MLAYWRCVVEIASVVQVNCTVPVESAIFDRTTINFCFQFHTGKKHGTKFIHTIIWCPEKAETNA